MYRKYILSLAILTLSSSFNPGYATEDPNKTVKLKDQAFETISNALFDEKIHSNMKVDIFSILNDIALGKLNEVQKGSQNDEMYDELITNEENNTLAVDIINAANKEETALSKNKAEKIDSHVIELLKKTINDPSSYMKLYGLEIISKAKIKELLPEVTKILDIKDLDEEIKSTTITTLGDIGDESTVQKLKLYLDDPQLRIKLNALQAIGEIDTPTSEQILTEYLTREPLEMALLSSGILAEKGNDKAISLLKEGIESPVMLTKQKTLIAMTNITNPKALPVLSSAMKVDDEVVQAYVLTILSNIDSPEAVKIAIAGLNNPNLMSRAYATLTNNTSPLALKVLEEGISSEDLSRKTCALSVLAKIKDKRIMPVLQKALNDKNEVIRVTAAKILHNFADKSGIPVIKEAVKSNNNKVSLSAATFLGFIGESDGKVILKQALSNLDLPSWKRLDISFILEKLGESSVLPDLKSLLNQQLPSSLPKDLVPTENTLKSLIKDKSKWIQINASALLSRKHDAEALPILSHLANDPDIKIRVTAVKLLGELGSEKALPVLQEHLSDEAVRVRVNSAESILKILTNRNTLAQKDRS